MNNIFTVGALTEQLRKNLESRFPFVWVRGEVTNLSRPASGHIYFSLKDSQAQLQCVWFSRRQGGAGEKFDPLTGEVYSTPRPPPATLIQNGVELMCAGSISVYASRGQYQLVVEFVQVAGAGLLAQAFEERKARLGALGYFEVSRKRQLPYCPRRIALVTSPHGAAIHDFLQLAANRGLSARIRIFPVQVQGDCAAREMVAAIARANAQNWAEVIVLARGGGSLEDLWAFNEENLAEAIFTSRLPVLAGIGHEIDFTLADLTADVRAATPSHAAQLLWPLRRELFQKVDELEMRLSRVMSTRLDLAQKDLDRKCATLQLLAPAARLRRLDAQCQELRRMLDREARRLLQSGLHAQAALEKLRIRAAGLRRMLDVRQEKLEWLRQAVSKAMRGVFFQAEGRLDNLEIRLNQNMAKNFAERQAALERAEADLMHSNPMEPLRRGYALLYTKNGIVRSTAGLEKGSSVFARLEDGMLVMTIDDIEPIKDSE